HLAGSGAAGDVAHNPARLFAVRRPVDLSAEPFHVVGELREVIIEVLDHVMLDGAGSVAQQLPARDLARGLKPAGKQTEGRRAIGLLEVRVPQRRNGASVDFTAVDSRL